METAESQANNAKDTGATVRWEIQTELGANGIRQLFNSSPLENIRNIEVVYVPQITTFDPNYGN